MEERGAASGKGLGLSNRLCSSEVCPPDDREEFPQKKHLFSGGKKKKGEPGCGKAKGKGVRRSANSWENGGSQGWKNGRESLKRGGLLF